LPPSVESSCNVGGFGIDGCLSTLLGASLANKDRLHFGVLGDLAAFYDLNSLGNRHVGPNLRILLVNNGKGTEFRQYGHHAAIHGDDTDQYIAAAGHFGNKSVRLIRHYAEDLGFEYLSASDKTEFEAVYQHFLNGNIMDRPILFEVFTNSSDESSALELIRSIEKETLENKAKGLAKKALGTTGVNIFRKALGK